MMEFTPCRPVDQSDGVTPYRRDHGYRFISRIVVQKVPAFVGTWASVDLAAAIRKLASVALKAWRQNELSLIRTRMIRSGKETQRFISRTVKPYHAAREHHAFKADCIHR
jgi:hypothetical protein